MPLKRLKDLFISDNFLRFWIAQSCNSFSNSITVFILPVIAAVSLNASPQQMGLLIVFQELPVFFCSLFVGVWLDRYQLKPILLLFSFMQALLLLLSLFLLSQYSFLIALYLVALLLGINKLVLDLAYTSSLPTLVEKNQLVPCNARLQLSTASLNTLAPALAGLLSSLLLPALVLLYSAASSLGAFFSLLFLPSSRDNKISHTRNKNYWHEMTLGLKVLFQNRQLRCLICSSCAGAFAFGIFNTLVIIAVTRDLGLTISSLGLLTALTALATFVATVLVPRASRQFGAGRSLIAGNILTTVGFVVLSLGTNLQVLSVLLSGLLLIGLGTPLYSVNQISIRQAITPIKLMGRVNAGRRFMVFSFLPIGAAFGGFVAQHWSTASGLYCAAIAMALGTIVVFNSTLRQRHLPETNPEMAQA